MPDHRRRYDGRLRHAVKPRCNRVRGKVVKALAAKPLAAYFGRLAFLGARAPLVKPTYN